MNIKNHRIILTVAAMALTFMAFQSVAQAALVPTYLLSTVNNNAQIAMTVYGADPNAPVMFYYPSASSMTSVNIGTTGSSGYFTITLNPITYNVAIGAPTYVVVDGAQSQTQAWPTYTTQSNNSSSGNLSLSQNSVAMTTGQSTIITAYVSTGNVGTLSVPSNTNSSVATAAVSGSQITVNASNAGSTAMTVCASNAGCVNLYITVQLSSTAAQNSNSSTISFSQTSVTMAAGQSQTISLYGPGAYYVSSNSNIVIVSANVSGSSLILNGIANGAASLNICSSGNNITSCGNVNVTVTSSSNTSTQTTDTSSQGNLSFNPSSPDLTIGQNLAVSITSPNNGVYYVSSNSNPNSVTANINGNSVNLTGVAFGGANINICQQGYGCNMLYAYVAPGSGTVSAAPASTITPVLSSFSISSNTVGSNFLGNGVALTFTFNVTQSIANKSVTVGGTPMPVYGSGTGPYSAIYTMTGSEAMPLGVSLTFSNAAGQGGQASFTIGGTAAAASTGSASSASAPSGSSQVFVSYLTIGSLSGEVTALQTRLTALGFYSGPITGKFGAQTEAAVKKYQAKHGINQLGAVGPATRTLLNSGE